MKRVAAGLLALSVTGAAFIAGHEGTRLAAYLDTGGVPTICTGSTEGVRLGQRATFEECNARLLRDTTYAGKAVAQCTHVSITQTQYDALVSLAFNAGGGAFCGSELVRKLNAGDCLGAGREFNDAPQIDRRTGRPRIYQGPPIINRRTGVVLLNTGDTIKKWTTAAGVPLPGLMLRRAEERTAFETGCQHADA